MSIEKMVDILLKVDVREDMSADNRAAIIRPFTPVIIYGIALIKVMAQFVNV